MRVQVLTHDSFRCVFPGCRSARNLDIHHIVFQMFGGKHELWNLCTVCGAHHKLLHDGLVRITGRAPDALVFERRRLELTERGRDSVVAPMWTRLDDSTELFVERLASPPARRTVAQPELGVDAELALVSMGFRKPEAKQAVARALADTADNPTLESVVFNALRNLAPRQR